MEDLSAMGAVETIGDLFLSKIVQREPVDIEADPTSPLTWRQAMLLGTVELGQVPDENGPSSSSGAQTSQGTA